TWNCGTPALGLCANAGVLASASNAPAIVINLACIMVLLFGFYLLRYVLRHLRHAFLARRIESKDPGAVEKRRRRHLAVVGELLARLHRHPPGAWLALGHIGPEPRLDIITVTREVARKHIAVLDRHVGALRQCRHGRMGGVAEQRHPPSRPF